MLVFSIGRGKKLIYEVCSVNALYLNIKGGKSVVIGRIVCLVNSVGRAPDLQAGGPRFSPASDTILPP